MVFWSRALVGPEFLVGFSKTIYSQCTCTLLKNDKLHTGQAISESKIIQYIPVYTVFFVGSNVRGCRYITGISLCTASHVVLAHTSQTSPKHLQLSVSLAFLRLLFRVP